MAALTKIFDRTAGQPIIADNDDAEFDNIYAALNGSSSDKALILRGNDPADAAVRIHQHDSGGTILSLRDGAGSGTERFRVDADGSVYIGGKLVDGSVNDLITFLAAASAVNNLQFGNAATGNAPSISAVGDDTDIPINLVPKGVGIVSLFGGGTLRLISAAFPSIQLSKTDTTARFAVLAINGDFIILQNTIGSVNFFSGSFIDNVITFTQIPVGPNANPTTGDQLTRKTYVDNLISSSIATAVPQPIGTGNSPTFAGLTVSGNESVGGDLDVNGQISIGAAGGAIKNITQGTVNVDPPTSAGGDGFVDITISGVSPGDIITMIPDPALISTDERYCTGSYVIDANTVRVFIYRFTAGISNNPNARTWSYIWFDLT